MTMLARLEGKKALIKNNLVAIKPGPDIDLLTIGNNFIVALFYCMARNVLINKT